MDVLLGKSPSPITFQAYPDMTRRPLPVWSHVQFDLGPNGIIEVHMEEQFGHPPLLAVRLTNTISMYVLPSAANSIYVRGEHP